MQEKKVLTPPRIAEVKSIAAAYPGEINEIRSEALAEVFKRLSPAQQAILSRAAKNMSRMMHKGGEQSALEAIYAVGSFLVELERGG